MPDMTFFEPVPQYPYDFHGTEIMRPVFYHNYTSIQASFFTPVENVRALLPSTRLRPMRFMPNTAVTVISIIEHRDSGVGPYSLALVGFPVTVDRDAPMMRGLLKVEEEGAGLFIWQMPENSQLAVDAGVEVAGYPKFMADVQLATADGWTTGRVSEGDRSIFTLSIRVPETRRVNRRWPGDIYVYKNGWIRRIPFVANIPHAGTSMKRADARLELGDHPAADELRQMNLGRPVNVQYSPDSQQILGTVLDGWKADRPMKRWVPS